MTRILLFLKDSRGFHPTHRALAAENVRPLPRCHQVAAGTFPAAATNQIPFTEALLSIQHLPVHSLSEPVFPLRMLLREDGDKYTNELSLPTLLLYNNLSTVLNPQTYQFLVHFLDVFIIVAILRVIKACLY